MLKTPDFKPIVLREANKGPNSTSGLGGENQQPAFNFQPGIRRNKPDFAIIPESDLESARIVPTPLERNVNEGRRLGH